MTELTFGEVFNEFCAWSPEHAAFVTHYQPWGRNSILVWFSNGYAYKVKYYAKDRFTMQAVSQEDINKKFGLNK